MRIRHGHLFDNTCADVVLSREKLAARDAVTKSFVKASCVMFGPPLIGLVGILLRGLIETVSEVFRVGFIEFQFNVDSAINRITIHFLKNAASKDCRRSTES